MRHPEFVTGHFYHIYNRGVDKRMIFLDRSYYFRFTSILAHYLQYDYSYSRLMQRLQKAQTPEDKEMILIDLKRSRIEPWVELNGFCLIPNHFHLTLKQLLKNGISQFMHRIGTSYTNYFNQRQDRSGRLFETTFKAVLVESGKQLVHLSRYQHINPDPAGLTQGLEDLINYPWSSLATFLRKPGPAEYKFVNPEPVLASFGSPQEYLEFIKAKVDEFEPIRLDEIAIDDDFGWFTRFRELDKARRQEMFKKYLDKS